MHTCAHLYMKYGFRSLGCCVFYVKLHSIFLLNRLNLQVDFARLLGKKLICSEYFLNLLYLGRNVISPRTWIREELF